MAGMGRGDEAASAFREAAKRSDEASISMNRALLADSQDQVRAALDLYDDAIRRLPKDPELVAARHKVLGRLGARERKSRATLRSRLCGVAGIGPSAAARLIEAGFDSVAKIRRASVSELRDAAALSSAQASGLKRAFRA